MSIRRAPLLGALLIAWAPVAVAQDLGELEQTLRKLADDATPKTVLIKAIAGPGQEGAGSGAIISPDGYILTCSHVIEVGKQRVDVVLHDGTTYPAKLLGRSKRQDYALLKIEAEGLPTFAMGDSKTVAPGDWVVALGHPGGPYPDLKPSFAAGKVIGLEAKLPVGMMSKYYNHAIVTDVPIYAGDSGGPLVNLEGELIGINGAIVMINELAFAIPLHQIQADMDRLKAGEVFEGEPPGPNAMAEMQKLISPEDYAKIQQRMFKNFGNLFGEDSPLSKLFGGENGENPFAKMFGGGNGEMPDLGELFGGGNGENPFGELFGNGEMDLSKLFDPEGPLGQLFGGGNGEAPDLSKLFDPEGPFGQLFGGGNGEAPDLSELFGGGNGENPFGKMFGQPQPRQPRQPAQPQGPRPFLGIRISQASGAALGGILVEDSLEGGPAAKAGLKKGDVVLAIDGVKTTDMPALRKAMAGKKVGQTVAVKVRRGVLLDTVLVEKELELSVTLGSR
jgi:S1-C subfamily serine protease